ncbi:unnamed protein product [Brachionus calyciflorus]|uniref:Uncharacterized protein n=1 Tax=Brachionus calyciflorus TaxID=104777 RepID=A0A814B4L6_9BILA|nr:unnamed protein product [Brachionus calyciflorus]
MTMADEQLDDDNVNDIDDEIDVLSYDLFKIRDELLNNKGKKLEYYNVENVDENENEQNLDPRRKRIKFTRQFTDLTSEDIRTNKDSEYLKLSATEAVRILSVGHDKGF